MNLCSKFENIKELDKCLGKYKQLKTSLEQ